MATARNYKCVVVIITAVICFLYVMFQYRMGHGEVQWDLLSFTPKVETQYHTNGKRTADVYVLDLLRKRQTAKDKADTTLFHTSRANNQSNAVDDDHSFQSRVGHGISHSPPIKKGSLKKNVIADVKTDTSHTSGSIHLTHLQPCGPLKVIEKAVLYNSQMYNNKIGTNVPNPDCITYISLSLMPGRTGNVMFQAAALIGIAKRNGFIPFIKDSRSKMDWFYFPDLNFDFPLENVKMHFVEMPGVYADETEHYNPAYNWSVKGYFQSWKYFENAASVVRRIFKIKYVYMAPTKDFLKSILKIDYVNAFLHYRRGDMLMASDFQRGYSAAGLDFVKKAMSFMNKSLQM